MTQPVLSLQLYSIKDQLTADLDGTLARLPDLGLRQVEAFDFVTRAPALVESFAQHGLEARTGHAPLLSEQVRGVGEEMVPAPAQEDVFAAAQTLGLEIVIDPYVPPERWLDEDQVTATADLLNQAAKRAADRGLRVGYHNHSQEFQASFGGQSAYEFFVERLDEEVVLEVDLYWAATAKQDVTSLLSRLGSRVKALHLKDGMLGPDPFAPGAPRLDPSTLDQRPAGQGEIPLLTYLAAAPSTEFAVIEFDWFDGDIFDGIGQSATYLLANGVQ